MTSLEERIQKHAHWGETTKKRVDTVFNRLKNVIFARINISKRQYFDELTNFGSLTLKHESEHGRLPTDEEIEAGMEKMRVKRAETAVLGTMDFLSLTLSLFYWVNFFAIPIALVGVWTVCALGDWAHRAARDGMKENDSQGKYHFRVFGGFAALFILCTAIAILSGIRIGIFAEEKKLAAEIAGTETFVTGGFVIFLSAVVGIFSFFVSLALAKKNYEYQALKDEWLSLYRALIRRNAAANRIQMLTAQLKSVVDRKDAKHRSIELRVQRKDDWSRWWDRKKKQLHQYLHGKPPVGPLSNSGGAAVVILTLLTFQTGNAQSFFDAISSPFAAKPNETTHVLLFDQTYSVNSHLRDRFAQATAIVVQTVEAGDAIGMTVIDGGWKASGELLYYVAVPEKAMIFQHENLQARLKARRTLTTQLDSLVSLRDSSYRWKTEIIHAINFIASWLSESGKGKAYIYVFSDMVEESDLGDFTKPTLDPDGLMTRLKAFDLIPDLKGASVLVVTPPVPVGKANLELRRREFWGKFFRASNAVCNWFGPNWIGFVDHMNKLSRTKRF